MSDLDAHATWSRRARAGMALVLAGQRPGWRGAMLFAGPAVVASIAYVDPGNFATNIQAGARYGYALLWVVVVANAVAMLFQALSAKLGIATGHDLAELCRLRLPRWLSLSLWGVSEVAAMATDLAEFLGGAIGLSLLFHLPLLVGMGVTAVATYGLLLVDRGGFRPLELIVGALVAVVAGCYLIELVIAPVDWPRAALGSVWPRLPDGAALTFAVAIVGATVMPHALFLHSGLSRARMPACDAAGRRMLVRFSNREVVVALGAAGLVNMAMVAMAASAFHAGHPEVAAIETAYRTLTPLLGGAAAAVFLTALMASGLSSSAVGTVAGQMIMQGFTGWHIPVWLRRLITMVPAFIVVGAGIDATRALILSQVVLSFALPIPVIALLAFTSNRSLMGTLVNQGITTLCAVAAAVAIVSLNCVLLWTFLK